MNNKTLYFKSNALEQRFQKEIRSIYCQIFLNILTAYFFIIGIPCVIISTVKWNISDVVVYSLASFTCITYHLIVNRYPQYYNLWINSLNLFASFAMGGQIYIIGPTIGIDDVYVLFFFGAAGFSLHVTVAFLSSNFLLTLTQTLSSTIVYYTVCWSSKIYAYKCAYGAFTLFLLYFAYLIQKNRREIFLLREYEKDWVQILKKGLSSCIITVKYDQKNNQIALDMINDQAKKLLQLSSAQEFKDFSRKTVIIDKFQDHEEAESISKLEQRNQFYMSYKQKKDDKTKNTLENRIINILKQHILHKMKINQKTQSKFDPKADKNEQTAAAEYVNTIQNGMDQIEDLFYGIFKKTEDSLEKRISIKASTYQNQTDCYCCLVIEEETNNQKVKILERVTLEQLKQSILQRYVNKCHEIDLKIKFINCSSDTVINTFTEKLNQVIMNLVDNSVKFQQSNQLMPNRCINLGTPIKQSTRFRTTSKSQIQMQDTLKVNDQAKQEQDLTQTIMMQREIKQFKDFKNDFKNILTAQRDNNAFQMSKLDVEELNLDYQYQKQQQDQLSINQTSSFQKEVIIQFELIKGESQQSNVFKVTVTDQGKGLNQTKLLKLLSIIGTKNPAYNSQYQNFDNLGWKINYHIIGNIGPFYNFFAQTNENQGLEYHFYIFQDIDILFNTEQNQSKIFSNNLFQENLEQSNQNYFHINNIHDQRIKVRKQSEENCSHIKFNTPLQQSIKFSINNNHKLIENADTQSLFGYQSMIFTDDLISQQKIPAQNLSYQLTTKFILDKTPNSASIYKKSTKEPQ